MMIKEKKKLHILRETRIGIPVFLGLLVLNLLVVSLAYRESFLPGTELAGVRCASLNAQEAADAVLEEAAGRRIELTDSSGKSLGIVTAAAFLDRDALRAEAETELAAQKEGAMPWAWILRRGSDTEIDLFSSLRASDVAAILSDELYGESGAVTPKDAELILGPADYILQEEHPGNAVDLNRCSKSLLSALRSCRSVGDIPTGITVPDGRLLPAITADGDTMRLKTTVFDNYLASNITIDFLYGSVYTFTPEDIWRMSDVSQTESAVTIAPNAEKVALFVDGLIEEYALDGVYAKFAHTAETRELVYYTPNDTGWQLLREALYDDVIHAMILGGESLISPKYDQTSWIQSLYGCSDTYIEVSIDNQYLWFYVDGQLVVETPVVTGCIANYDFTRRGFFWITSITTDVYLQGPTWYDHVDYWMPFDDQIGLHDSSWRSEYGGDIYLTDGSHGCVNTPLEAMQVIYEYAREGTIVIVY